MTMIIAIYFAFFWFTSGFTYRLKSGKKFVILPPSNQQEQRQREICSHWTSSVWQLVMQSWGISATSTPTSERTVTSNRTSLRVTIMTVSHIVGGGIHINWKPGFIVQVRSCLQEHDWLWTCQSTGKKSRNKLKVCKERGEEFWCY